MASQSYELSFGLSVLLYLVLLTVACILLVLGIRSMLMLNTYAERFWHWLGKSGQTQPSDKAGQEKKRKEQSLMKEE